MQPFLQVTTLLRAPATRKNWQKIRPTFCCALRHYTHRSPNQNNNKVSSESTLVKIASWIQDCAAGDANKNKNNSKPNILVLCGAGVSVAAGIPDFRSPGTGLYDNLQRYLLPYPEAVFDVNYFREHPQAFMSLAKDIWPGLQRPNEENAPPPPSPTLTHSFLALLEQQNLLLRCYTQNIDGLEVLGGVSPSRMVECHGHFRTASCIECGAEANIERMKKYVLRDPSIAPSPFAFPGEPPICETCRIGYVKPDVVFFGEPLPDTFRLLEKDLRAADLLIILGTSLQVGKTMRIMWVSELSNFVNIERLQLSHTQLCYLDSTCILDSGPSSRELSAGPSEPRVGRALGC